MSPERREELERWAAALGRSEVAELRAAGRAIATLCAENAELERRLAKLEREDGGEPPPQKPPSAPPAPRDRPGARRRALPWRRSAIVVAAAALVVGALAFAARAAAPGIALAGPRTGALLDDDSVVFSAPASSAAAWRLDGRRVIPLRRGTRLELRLDRLGEGPHTLVVSRHGRLFTSAKRTVRFVVDTKPPLVRLTRPAVVHAGEPLTIRGRVEPGARLTRGVASVPLDPDGSFVLRPPGSPRRLLLVATDAAGNRSRWRVPVTIAPRRPAEPLRAVHVTSYAWADRTLREGVLALVRERRINAVELDLKDEAGEIGWNPPLARARRIGAAVPVYDLAKAVRQLHADGVRVIGRLVCFRDPILAAAAWKAGRRDEVIQTPGGEPYAGYGGFTNFASPAVRKYNVEVAVEAAKLGVDEILYDYVRRPDGPTGSMVFPGLRGTPELAIVRFLRESRRALAGTKALLGASVFGVAATRPLEVAQDIPAMARQLDYVAPMLYPSHWGPGEYDVADPNGSPYAIVRRSMADFVRQARGSGARIVPWLQDFSLGRPYGPAEVRAQIAAARDAGADEFLLWDAAVTYTADALDRGAPRPALGLTRAAPQDAPWPVRLPDRAPAKKPQAQPRAGSQPTSGLPPNELGSIPVVTHHQVRPDRVGDYDQTPREFRAELETLWRRGYVPIRVSDLVDGRIDLPKGMSPVVLTFDDSTKEQLAVDAAGSVKPGTAVGIMLAFARTHPGFRPAGTFYPNREPFAGVSNGPELLRWLTRHGFELGNHTHDHIPLRTLSDEQVQRQLVTGAEVIERALPGYRIRSLALPLGSMPRRAGLAVRGRWHGRSYGPYAVLLVGANPSPSPFSRSFDRTAIPRIRTSHLPWQGDADFALAYWLRQLQRNPSSRYVSDGDPAVVTAPKGAARELRPALSARARFLTSTAAD